LVYLPFEENEHVLELLGPLKEYDFYIYAPGLNDSDQGHIHTRKPSREGFQKTLANSRCVISNSGFELISEALMLGKRIFTKPVVGQMEQQSNAQALQDLGLATICNSLTTAAIANWLNKDEQASTIRYPDVPAAICEWLIDSNRSHPQQLADDLWDAVEIR